MNDQFSLVKCLICMAFFSFSVTGLKCKTKHQIEQQKDFYNLASDCMRNSVNYTKMSYENDNDEQSKDHDESRLRNNVYRTTNFYNNAYQRDRNNQNTFSAQDGESCVLPTRHNHQTQYKFRERGTTSRTKRNTLILNHRNRKNNTQKTDIKSPLQEIGACVVHCIFKEMDLLNSASRPDRESMIRVLTRRIQDSELREFIQDSIDECFEALDNSDNTEESCEHSKKLLLCLEEKAQKNCEDWEDDNIDSAGNEQRTKLNTEETNGNNYYSRRESSIVRNPDNKNEENRKKNRFNYNIG